MPIVVKLPSGNWSFGKENSDQEWEDLEMGSHVDNPKQGSKVCDGPEIHQQRPSAPMIESMVWSVQWLHLFFL